MNILFLTFGQGHLVSDKEFDRLQKGFFKVGMNLYRQAEDYDIVMVKGFSHTWEQVKEKNKLNKPVVYYSIGTEFKHGIDLKEANEPIRELYENANAVVHVSEHCKWEHGKVFGKRKDFVELPSPFTSMPLYEHVILPACEPRLPESPEKYPSLTSLIDGAHTKLKLAVTCIPRPVKRIEEMERLCKKFDVELVPAWGGVSDFSYYYDCHGGLCLSRKEGMPNNVLEMMSYGLPCLVTNYGGAKEVISNGCGVILKNDPEDIMWDPSNIEPIDDFLFAEALEIFIQNIPQMRMRVRQKVLTQLNDVVTANKFKEVFQSLMKGV